MSNHDYFHDYDREDDINSDSKSDEYDNDVDNDVIDKDDDEYDIHDPRTKEHEAFKMVQEQGAMARRRYKFGNNVDANGFNHSPHESDNEDTAEEKLESLREARG